MLENMTAHTAAIALLGVIIVAAVMVLVVRLFAQRHGGDSLEMARDALAEKRRAAMSTFQKSAEEKLVKFEFDEDIRSSREEFEQRLSDARSVAAWFSENAFLFPSNIRTKLKDKMAALDADLEKLSRLSSDQLDEGVETENLVRDSAREVLINSANARIEKIREVAGLRVENA